MLTLNFSGLSSPSPSRVSCEVTTYRRRGHWRRGKDGQRHWVSAHSVNRTGSSGWLWRSAPGRPVYRAPAPAFPPPVRWRRVPAEPNATCPVCGARVWFFRNKRGGCAYFDAVGAPWPKHPCMELPGLHDHLADHQAKQAYERQQARLARRARWVALAEERRLQRAGSPAERAAGRRRFAGLTTRVGAAPAGDAADMDGHRRWALGWWTVFAMLLAWLGSLPISYSAYVEMSEPPIWPLHLLVGMPTVVTMVSIVRFLLTVPAPRPTLGRVAGALLLAPIFLMVGIPLFLFTIGFGSLGFAWFLWWQGRPPSASMGEQQA